MSRLRAWARRWRHDWRLLSAELDHHAQRDYGEMRHADDRASFDDWGHAGTG